MQKYFFDFIFLDILRAGWKSRLGRSFTARLIYGTGLAGVRLARRRHGGGGGSFGEQAVGRGLTGVGVTRRRRQVYVILFAVILLCSEMINTHISNTKTMYQATQDKTIQISRFMTAEHLHGVCDAYLDGG